MCLPRINLIQRQEQCANRIHLSSVHQPIFKASSLIFNGLTAGKDMEHGTRCTSLEFFSLSAFLPLFSYRIYIHRPRTSRESNWLKPLGLSRTSWGTISDGATTRKSANVNDASWPPVLNLVTTFWNGLHARFKICPSCWILEWVCAWVMHQFGALSQSAQFWLMSPRRSRGLIRTNSQAIQSPPQPVLCTCTTG
ncbi:hypothetical protein D915_010359 [Fasciola hepatica]|uniref:Uncharacterized protein n=1 Tax=Fasciola hepatica TaxID=6192 RepID=A0A4E0RA97_FASHE|nr:hypothetical protein D915_010359 [Fasciola hepatica]